MRDLKAKTQEEIKQCIKNQMQVCDDRKFPHFAPEDGRCWKCNRNIYQNYLEINSAGRDGTIFITGCPHCSRSYCD